MELNDTMTLLFAEARTQYASMLEETSKASDVPLFISANGTVYMEEGILGLVLSNMETIQSYLMQAGYENVAVATYSMNLIIEAIHDAAHLEAVPHE